MKVELHLKATVFEKDGIVQRIGFDNPTYYRQQLQQLKGHRYASVVIKGLKRQRSGRQNAYWHGVCYPILAELTGHTEAEVKELTKQMFLKPRIVTIRDKEYELRTGTSDLNVAEGVEYTDNLRQLAVELDGYIPTPAEAGYHQGNESEDIRDSGSYPEDPENIAPTF
jgi:hypothetical protein